MGSEIFYPAASADDGMWVIGGGYFSSGDSLDFGDWADTEYSSFIRFDNVIIPQGDTVTSAFVRLTAYNWTSDVVVNINLYFNNEDDATNPTDVASADGKSVTAGVDWDSISAFVNLTTYDTPELKDILQTVINRAGWNSGNHVLFFLKGENESSTNAYRSAQPYNYSGGAYKAELHVEFETPVPQTVIHDLNTNIGALRSKWWLNTDIQAGVYPESIQDLLSEIIVANPVREDFLLLRYDHVPARDAQNVQTGKAMQFRLYNPDTAFGIDLATFKLRFDEGAWYRYGDSRLTFTEVNYREYLIYFNPPNFAYGSQVNVELYCEDHLNNPGIKLEIL